MYDMRILKIIPLIFFVLMIAPLIGQAADYKGGKSGIGVLYSSDGVLSLSFDVRGVTIGVFGKNWTTAEEREVGTSNYGQTRIGELDSIYGLDIGYSYPVLDYLRIGAEISGGLETTYGKFSDERFSEGYYISEEKEEWLVGLGLTAAIPITEKIAIAINGNTLKGVSGGILIRFR